MATKIKKVDGLGYFVEDENGFVSIQIDPNGKVPCLVLDDKKEGDLHHKYVLYIKDGEVRIQVTKGDRCITLNLFEVAEKLRALTSGSKIGTKAPNGEDKEDSSVFESKIPPMQDE